MTDTAVETPLFDLVASALDAMRRGGAMRVMDIPDDSSYASHTFTGGVSKEIARRADLAAVPAQVRVKPLVWTGGDRVAATGMMLHEVGVVLDRDKVAEFEKERADEILSLLDPQPDPRDEVIARLVEAAHNCVDLLDGLIAESGRSIEWGAEDPFRMGEWFGPEDLAQIHAARAALAAAKAVQP